jgi:hypothetical protein
MNEVVDMIGELSVDLSFAADFRRSWPRGPARSALAPRSMRCGPPKFLDGGEVAYFGKAEGEREKGGHPKGFRDWALERRNAPFAGFNVGWIYCRRRDQPTAACKRTRRSLFARLVRKGLGCG